jgi:hypothetical protein
MVLFFAVTFSIALAAFTSEPLLGVCFCCGHLRYIVADLKQKGRLKPALILANMPHGVSLKARLLFCITSSA